MTAVAGNEMHISEAQTNETELPARMNLVTRRKQAPPQRRG